jgi:hypothetical protein
MRNLIRSSAVAGALLAMSVVAASATTIDIGTTTPGQTATLGSNPLQDIVLTSSGPFSDDFFFNLTSAGLFSANAIEGTSAGGGAINPFTISLLSVGSTTTTLASSSTPVVSGNNESISLSGVSPLAAGNYELVVSGTATSGLLFPVDVSGNITISPTPLPGTLALFGSGLVGLWGWSRKRDRKSTVVGASHA